MLVELGLVEQRYQAVLDVLNNGATVTDVARRHGVSRQTVHEWLVKYANHGLAGLVDRRWATATPRSPCSPPRGQPVEQPQRPPIRNAQTLRETPHPDPSPALCAPSSHVAQGRLPFASVCRRAGQRTVSGF